MFRQVLTAAAGAVLLCSAALAQDDAVASMMQADRDFAALAAEVGVETAFATYMDSVDGRLIRGTPDPVTGEAAIRESFAGWPEAALLHWEPLEGFASDAGDFGVTWGVWSIHPDGDRASAPAGRGTYVTVWRRDADGNWRGLLDMGTEDPSYRPDSAPADSQSIEND